MSPEMSELKLCQERFYEGVQLISVFAEGAVQDMVDILRIIVTRCLAFHVSLFAPSALCD